MAELNLKLDVDWVGHDESRREVVRVCVASTHGFTRNGGAPTITVDCADKRTFDAEIERLRRELDAVSARGHKHFGEDDIAVAPIPEIGPSELSPTRIVGDVMTKSVKTLERNDELSLVKELMDAGQFRHIVVVDGDGRLAGVISRQDIYYGALAWSLGMSKPQHDKALKITTAKAVMRTDVLTTTPEAPIREAAALMLDNKVGCLPVLNGVQLVGIVTESDLLAQITK